MFQTISIFSKRAALALAASALFGLGIDVSPALAQPPATNPNEMCGTGETFTVNLPGTTLGIDDSHGFWRSVDVPSVADADTVTLPKGCRIYAFLISGFGDNADYDRIIFYKVAEFVAQNNGYVHVGWWNNFTKEYMARPLHQEIITIQKMIPILGIPVGPPVIIHPTPKTEGIPDAMLTTSIDLPKANPDEDIQFLSDAERVLKAVRQHNPHALIIVVGHSMGGNAVARLGATAGVPIDLLAPIDPVGNRDTPRADPESPKFNWTRWRAAINFRGYKQWDCVRNSNGFCADTDSNPFTITFSCTTSTTPWLPDPPTFGSRAPLICPRTFHEDPGVRLSIGTNVRHLYHRWQQEFLWPLDFETTQRFNRPAAFPLSTTNILSPNHQAAVQQNPPLNIFPNDPNKTCSTGIDPRDSSFLCNPTEGHGEIIGVRVDGLLARVRPGLELTGNWPARTIVPPFNNAERRQKLIQMAVDGPAWPYRPQNPDLCMVCDDIITITEHLMSQQTWEEEEGEDTVAPASHATQEPDANPAGWVNEDVVVSVSASDEGSGVEEITVTLSGAQSGSATTPGTAAQATISAEGLTTVSYFANDQAGNTEQPVHTLELRIDKTAPEIAALTDITANSAGWIASPVVVSFPASDSAGGSGLASSTPDVTIGTEGTNQEVTGQAEDIAGNVSTTSVTLNIDLTPPGIALASRTPANAAGWNNSDVSVLWTCTDGLSGPGSPSVSASRSSEGAGQTALGTCVDLAGNSAGETESGINIDKTAPTVTIGAPADGAVLLLNAPAASNYACADSLSGVQSCSGPVANGSAADTSAVGNKQFTVNASDAAGNTASASNSYSVRYGFPGFASPIAPMPLRNVVNGGRTVPVKYVVHDANGALITSVATFASLVSSAAACDATAPGVLVEETESAGSTEIRWDAAAQQFIYNWKTEKAWSGTCRVLQLTLNDGAKHLALFQFK